MLKSINAQEQKCSRAKTIINKGIHKRKDFHEQKEVQEKDCCEKELVPMKKLLIVDDEVKIRELIAKYALFEGYETDEADGGAMAVEKCKNNKYDLVIMDIMMDKTDGFTASEQIREFSDVPIIMLTARGEEYDRIKGFKVGADDYVVKPFSPKELMLRVAAVISRSEKTPAKSEEEIFEAEGLKIDFPGRMVYVNGERINLSPKEYELLFYMVRNRNIALYREQFIKDIWGYDFYGEGRTLDTHIKLLRRNLGEYSKFIVTIRGVGYRFEVK